MLTLQNSSSPSRNSRHMDGQEQFQQRKSILYLKRNHVVFDPPDRRISIFFDECNRDVISIYGVQGSKTQVLFQATDEIKIFRFNIPVQKRILSIKLNTSRDILAYHVEKSIVEFINIDNVESVENDQEQTTYTIDEQRYIQASRARNCKLLGFIWTSQTEIVIISDITVEYYSVDRNKHRLRHLKSFQTATNWFVYQPNVCKSESSFIEKHSDISVLMISTGSLGNSIQPFIFHHNQIFKLDKFIVDGNWEDGNNLELFEQSITIAHIYSQIRLLVLQHESMNTRSNGAQILVYTVNQESGQTIRTHTLDLNLNGRFALNVIDNLVVAHDQPSKSSFIFDISAKSTEKSDCPQHFVDIARNQTIRPPSHEEHDKKFDMYSANWVFFQPNFIIDVKRGSLCTLHLDLVQMDSIIHDKILLLDFLSFREDSHDLILSISSEIVGQSLSTISNEPNQYRDLNGGLCDVSSCFEVVQKLLVSAQRVEEVSKRTSKVSKVNTEDVKHQLWHYGPLIEQEDFYRLVLKQLEAVLDKVGSNPCFSYNLSLWET